MLAVTHHFAQASAPEKKRWFNNRKSEKSRNSSKMQRFNVTIQRNGST
jgi:hypothetical protein